MPQLIESSRPAITPPDALPPLPAATHAERLDRARRAMRQAGFDALVVYGDREHAANLAYLTGFDPRFEEALLVLPADGQPTLLVGNECLGYLPDPALEIETVLYQEFSLPGQPRGDSRPIADELRDAGLGADMRLGLIGWKPLTALAGNAAHASELPAYLVDALVTLVGDRTLLRNAASLLMDPDTGLRCVNEIEQIARFEYAAWWTSESIAAAVAKLAPGVEEHELERCYHGGGLPRCCHPMVGFGDKVRRGLASPSNRRAELGDAFTLAYGIWGALTCRAGVIAEGPDDLPGELANFFPRLVANYFDVVATWYSALRIDRPAGEVYAAVEAARDDTLYTPAVNPGHLIHQDEWVHSPFIDGGSTPLRSGVALQMDIIPVSKGPFCYVNAEDGVVLADGPLRDALRERYPGLWRRVTARRDFMVNTVGIELHDSVLPMGNTSGWLPPYAMAPHRVMAAD